MSFAMIDQMDTITHTLRAMSTMIVHYVIPLDWLQEHLMHRFLKSQSIHTWCWVVVVGGGGGCGVCVCVGGYTYQDCSEYPFCIAILNKEYCCMQLPTFSDLCLIIT